MSRIKWPKGVPVPVQGLDRDEFLDGCPDEVQEKYSRVSDEVAELRCELAWRLYEKQGLSEVGERRELEERIEEAGEDGPKVWVFEKRRSGAKAFPVPISDDPGLKSAFLSQVARFYRDIHGYSFGYAQDKAEMFWRKSDAAKRKGESQARGPLAVKSSGDVYTLAGYGVVYGGRDIEREYFTPETDFWLDTFKGIRWPVLYQHGANEHLGKSRLGEVVDRFSDEVGLFLRTEIRKAHEYAEAVASLASEGLLGYSTGSVSHLMEKAADGRILTWPIVEVSLTTTPAEPRTLGVRALRALAAGDSPYAKTLRAHVLRGEVTA